MAGPVKAWDASGNPIASPPSQAWDAQGNPVSSAPPNAGLAPPVGPKGEIGGIQPPKTEMDSGEGPLAAGMTSFETQLSQLPKNLWNASFFGEIGNPEVKAQHEQRNAAMSAPGLGGVKNTLAAANPVQKIDVGTPNERIDWGATAANILPMITDLAGRGITESPVGKLAGIAKRAVVPTPPPENLVPNTYSPAGDHISSALRSNTKVDVPAEAKIAAPAIEEGLNDRGISTKSFKGRNGPTALQSGIDNALDIHEARAKAMIDPIRGETVDPQVLAQNPELAGRLAAKNPPGKPVTYGDLDAERIQLNKELRMGNFYSKPPSAQYAIQDPLASVHQAANQARDLVYGKVGETTGLDIAPIKRTESALIKLGDLAETTKNTLSPKEAQFNTTPLLSKVKGSAQGLLSVKANPINAFSIPEKPGLFNPLNEFNSHMQKAFPDLKAAAADRTVSFPRYNLQLTPPAGQLPGPVQQILNLTGGEHVPGPQLQLTSPGSMPPDVQRPLSFMEGPNPNQSGPVAPGGVGTVPAPKTTGNVPRSLGAAAAAQMPPEVPEILRGPAGIGGGHAGGGVASAEELARPGKNYVVDTHGKLTYHGKAFAPESTPRGGAHVTVLPDGNIRVNEGTLTPAMERALKNGIKK